jgi:hypothetical protein
MTSTRRPARTADSHVEGAIAGESFESDASIQLYSFVNKLGEAEPGMLQLGLGSGDVVLLEWDRLVANGDSVDARGTVDFSASSGVHYGNCESDGFPGTLHMDEDGDGGAYRLRRLRAEGSCSASQEDGEIVGCFRSPRF